MAKRTRFLIVSKELKRKFGRFLKVLGIVLALSFLAVLSVFVFYISDLPRPEKFSEGLIFE